MLTFGSQHCLAASRGTGDERLGATYYDSLRVYLNLLLYTRDPKWNQCIAASLNTWRTWVIGGGGGVPGYWNFTGGLRLHYEQTRDTISRSAVALLAANAAFCSDTTPADYTTSASLSREVAYCIEARLDAMALGFPKTAYYDLMVTTALRHLDQWWVSKTYRAPAEGFDGMPGGVGNYYIQPFMVGLTTHALMREWERSHDARILPLVKAALDGLWARAWVSTDQAFWYENFVTNPSTPFPPQPGAPDLNQLIAPGFLLYSKATGDDVVPRQGRRDLRRRRRRRVSREPEAVQPELHVELRVREAAVSAAAADPAVDRPNARSRRIAAGAGARWFVGPFSTDPPPHPIVA